MARRAGVALEAPTPQGEARERHRARLQDALSAGLSSITDSSCGLRIAEPARAYLTGRDFGGEVARAFELGWSPAGWDGLITALRTDGFSDEDLIAAGLARERESGGLYDYFRGRLMIPIRDPRGRRLDSGRAHSIPAGSPSTSTRRRPRYSTRVGCCSRWTRPAPASCRGRGGGVVEGYTEPSAPIAPTAPTSSPAWARPSPPSTSKPSSAAPSASSWRWMPTRRSGGHAARAGGGAGGLVGETGGRCRRPTARALRPPAGCGPAGGPHCRRAWTRTTLLRADPDVVAGGDPCRAASDELPHRGCGQPRRLDSPRGKSEAVEQLSPFLQEIPTRSKRADWVAEVARRVRVSERSIVTGWRPPKPPRRARPAPIELPSDDGPPPTSTIHVRYGRVGHRPLAAARRPLGPANCHQPSGDLAGQILGSLLLAPRGLRT